MTLDHAVPRDDDFPLEKDPTIECTHCHSAEYLLIESIQSLSPLENWNVDVEYSCGKCESFYAHTASIESVAKLLAARDDPCDVLKIGDYFIHCATPMQETRIRLSAKTENQDDGEENSGDSLSERRASRVLRCRCGFQIAVAQ